MINDNINEKYDFIDFPFKIIDTKNIKKYYFYVYNNKMSEIIKNLMLIIL